jgi:hypothetical protein
MEMIAGHASTAAAQVARDEIAAQVQAYRALVAAASKASGMSLARIDAALADFEPAFFANLLLALELRFVHRTCRGGALDEVRLLASALTAHGGVMAADPTIPYDAGKAVLGLDIGDRIALDADDFAALSAAFLAAIEAAPGPAR